MGHYSLLVLLAYFNVTGTQLSIGFIFGPIDQWKRCTNFSVTMK